MGKQRADALLVEKGLVESRTLAQRMVMAGQVRANGQIIPKPSTLLSEDASLEVETSPLYLSRGGYKLEAALEKFSIDVKDNVCADVGASTGGFTDCLLQHGATKVYAIDVGRGQLHWALRQDKRVVSMEKTNARDLANLPEQVDLVTIDVSFISLKLLLPVVRNWLKEAGLVIALIKPQFEAGKEEASRAKGVIRDPDVHRSVLEKVTAYARREDLFLADLALSPLKGPKGNVEFLAYLKPEKTSLAKSQRLFEDVLLMAAKKFPFEKE